MNKPDPLLAQYANADNFNARVELGRRFNTNQYGWSRWVFDRISFPPNASVLELGCGPAYLWAGNLRRVPGDASILLTDFSAGMLDEAKKTLGTMAGFFRYATMDAQQIALEDASLDVVIANHMLYHVPDRKKALAEISRVLKPGGVFYATTIGRGNLKELGELFRVCFSLPALPRRTVADAFGLENGAAQLKEFFRDVTLEQYENSLEVTEAGPMADYILSAKGVSSIENFLTPERKTYFEGYLNRIIEKNGSIHITKESGLFVAKGKR